MKKYNIQNLIDLFSEKTNIRRIDRSREGGSQLQSKLPRRNNSLAILSNSTCGPICFLGVPRTIQPHAWILLGGKVKLLNFHLHESILKLSYIQAVHTHEENIPCVTISGTGLAAYG
jgi:hypothetical protein